MSDLIISIQGERASFHDMATTELYGEHAKRLYRSNFRGVFEDVATGAADFGIVAIENSLVGSINEVYDLLRAHPLKIVGEKYLRISQNLLGLPGANLSDITNVYSHPMALLQSEQYLDQNLAHAEIHERHDTAAAAEYVQKSQNIHLAAIASKQAANIHRLEVLAEDIETDKHNYTRFFVLSKTIINNNDVNKTSLVVKTSHEPGALFRVLEAFYREKINLSKLSSRPIPEATWQYYFYIDIESGIHEERTKRALEKIEQLGNSLTVLGSYSADTIEA